MSVLAHNLLFVKGSQSKKSVGVIIKGEEQNQSLGELRACMNT